MKRVCLLILAAVSVTVLLLPIDCSSQRTIDLIIGKWQGDPDNAKLDPTIIKEAEGNPMGEFFLKAMEEYYKSLKVEITRQSLSIDTQFPGEDPQKQTVTYSVSASGKGTVTIQSKESGARAGTLVIKIVDKDHIRITKEGAGEEEPAYILKRQK
jgi:hypothetical protein